ncbi:hypothetical protein DPM19_26185 [Actinomadura craniellae]|uniref:DUF8094 domain-containing protein n=1 Tax=Actinomadura craniellae TaxID=2231787 RepID=A0A365GZG4_9ACTN|nr:hypothetical protein DPM19_26185 [Actinomadura craniellae]
MAMVAALALTGVAGCSDGPDRTAAVPIAAASTPAPERLTLEVAAQAFRSFIANDDVARASGDERLALSWAADGHSQLTAAEYRKAAFVGDPVPRYDYGTPALYVPRLTTYPQWFVVSVPRTVRGEEKSERTAMLAFVRKSAGVRWRLSLATLLGEKTGEKAKEKADEKTDEKTGAPKVVLDGEGYATALATFDDSLVLRPNGVSAIQATLGEEGPDSVAARVMKSGPHTTGYYTRARRAEKKEKEAGVASDDVLLSTQSPIFALRTVGGGGLVLYAMTHETVTLLRNKERGRLGVPRGTEHLLNSIILTDEVHVTEMLQFAAAVPAKPGPKARSRPRAEVIAAAGDTVRAAVPQTP